MFLFAFIHIIIEITLFIDKLNLDTIDEKMNGVDLNNKYLNNGNS